MDDACGIHRVFLHLKTKPQEKNRAAFNVHLHALLRRQPPQITQAPGLSDLSPGRHSIIINRNLDSVRFFFRKNFPCTDIEDIAPTVLYRIGQTFLQGYAQYIFLRLSLLCKSLQKRNRISLFFLSFFPG